MNSSLASIELIEAPQFPLGFYSIAADVENLDAAVEEIKSRGGTLLGEIILTTLGRQIFLLDNNQNRMCLIEHSK